MVLEKMTGVIDCACTVLSVAMISSVFAKNFTLPQPDWEKRDEELSYVLLYLLSHGRATLISRPRHSERSEESVPRCAEILRCAQNDTTGAAQGCAQNDTTGFDW